MGVKWSDSKLNLASLVFAPSKITVLFSVVVELQKNGKSMRGIVGEVTQPDHSNSEVVLTN